MRRLAAGRPRRILVRSVPDRYGRAKWARQIVGSVLHVSDHPDYRRLNDTVCVAVGEVRSSVDTSVPGPELVLDVAEVIWEPIAP